LTRFLFLLVNKNRINSRTASTESHTKASRRVPVGQLIRCRCSRRELPGERCYWPVTSRTCPGTWRYERREHAESQRSGTVSIARDASNSNLLAEIELCGTATKCVLVLLASTFFTFNAYKFLLMVHKVLLSSMAKVVFEHESISHCIITFRTSDVS